MSTNDVGTLRDDDWNRLQSCASRFEHSWQQRENVLIDEFLPPTGDSLRLTALHELIKTDLEMRWRRGQRPLLESYLERHPELGNAENLPAALIVEEFRVRQRLGDRPDLSAYQRRFPRQFPDVERIIAAQPPVVPLSAQDSDSPGVTVTTAGAQPAANTQPAHAPSPAPNTHPAAAPSPTAGAVPSTGITSGRLAPTVSGTYQLLGRIGSGGFAEVWKALAPGGMPAAVKVVYRSLDHEEAQRELKSLETMKLLNHHHLLRTQAWWIDDGRLHIAMELADGTLRDRLKQCHEKSMGGLPLDELMPYIKEAAQAVDYLHERKVLHRDIKPDNMLLVQGHIRVADFGLARLRESDATVMTGGACGTAPYMAPEVFWETKCSERSDLYSLAVSYVELRLGRRPFAGSTFMDLMQQHRKSSPDLDGLFDAEKVVLQKALNKERSQRQSSCVAFAEELEAAVARYLRNAKRPTVESPTVQANGADSSKVATNGSDRGSVERGSKTEVVNPPQRREVAAAAQPSTPYQPQFPWVKVAALFLVVALVAAGWLLREDIAQFIEAHFANHPAHTVPQQEKDVLPD
jgi:serine/threonine protein kinase